MNVYEKQCLLFPFMSVYSWLNEKRNTWVLCCHVKYGEGCLTAC